MQYCLDPSMFVPRERPSDANANKGTRDPGSTGTQTVSQSRGIGRERLLVHDLQRLLASGRSCWGLCLAGFPRLTGVSDRWPLMRMRATATGAVIRESLRSSPGVARSSASAALLFESPFGQDHVLGREISADAWPKAQARWRFTILSRMVRDETLKRDHEIAGSERSFGPAVP
jgi:hypothetical protein